MNAELRIADDFALPLELVTQAVAILAKRRAGKSYTARRLVEQLYHAGQQIVIVDPKGDWWGVRSSADGTRPGLPIVILGGEHRDIPLSVGAGEAIARFVVEERVSVLLDLSDFRKGEVATFMAYFLETLYRLKAREHYRTPMMLMIDEADAIAPQRAQDGEQRMLGAAEDIVRRGGQRGIGCVMVTQRPAVLNKNVLTQAQMVVALRTIAPQDLKALNDWIDVHGTPEQRKELMASLPSLPIGTAWFWSPGWPTDVGIFRQVRVAPIETYDSGATPKPGERRAEPRTLAEVDLPALRDKLAATIEKAAADDPKALRAQIADLQKQLRAKPATAAPTVERVVETIVERVEVPVLTDEQIARLVEATDAARSVAMRLIDAADGIKAALVDARPLPQPTAAHAAMTPSVIATPASSTASPAQLERARLRDSSIADSARNITVSTDQLGKGARGLLQELARRHPMRVTRTQLATLAGRGSKSSSYDQQLAELRRRGLVDHAGGELSITAAGLELAGAELARPRTSEDVIETWRRALPDGARRLFDVLVALRGDTIDRADLALNAGMSPTSSSTDQHLSTLRRNGLADGHMGAWRALRTLFLEPAGQA